MKKLAYITALLATPAFAFAAVNNVQDLGQLVINIINGVAVPVIFAIAFIVFIWGVFQYFIAGGHDEEKRETGKSLMLYGIIGFFVMVSVWGLVRILTGTFGLDNKVPDYGPTLPTTHN